MDNRGKTKRALIFMAGDVTVSLANLHKIFLFLRFICNERTMKGSLLNQICAEYTLADEVKAMGIYPYYRPIESGQDPVVKMNGKDVLMFGSNSYLGLSDDPRLKEAGSSPHLGLEPDQETDQVERRSYLQRNRIFNPVFLPTLSGRHR